MVAKTVKNSWLWQNTNLASATTGAPVYEIYVFATNQGAGAAFNLIANDSNAREEYGDGGTFRRGNVVISTDQGEPGALTADAEKLLNKCVGGGASQATTRAGQEVVDGQTRSERQRSEEDGAAPSTGETTPTAASTTAEPAQEPPTSEDAPNPGQSPASTREGG